MLGLKLPTDPRWANIAEKNLQELLTDHAYCEQKAASNAISIIVHYPEFSELVNRMSEIAREELEHFQQVHERILARGWQLGRERKDPYVNDLAKFMVKDKGRERALIERLLFAAMIEARSCERFRVLSTEVEDKELAQFYHDLMASEAGHYTTFLKFAREIAASEGLELDVDARWQEWLDYEAQIIARYGKGETIHG